MENTLARKKTILKKDILKTAYVVATEDGFKNLTARNIAKKMDCSTQPIYLEFASMDDLKQNVVEEMQNFVYETIFPREVTGHPLVDTCVNYIAFAKEEKNFFSTLYLEGEIDPQKMHDLSLNYFNKAFESDDLSKKIKYNQKEYVFETVWPFVHGTASLVAQGCLPYNRQSIINNIDSLIDTALENGQVPCSPMR